MTLEQAVQELLADCVDASQGIGVATLAAARAALVNVSPRQLSEPTFADVVERIIADADLPEWRVCLEVTESALMEVDAASEVLRRLKRVGVELAIDDFGTAYSSLSRLRGFPVDYLKIDRSFVAGIVRSAEDRIIVSSVVGLAHSLGLSVIAEGIDNAGQLDLLIAEGCEAGQGFLWGAAVPPEKASHMVRSPGPVRLRQLQRRRIGAAGPG